MRLTVTVKPSAREQRIVKMADGSLVVYLKSPPVEGKANEELVSFLAEFYRVPKSAVSIYRGHKGRTKIIDIDRKALAEAKSVTEVTQPEPKQAAAPHTDIAAASSQPTVSGEEVTKEEPKEQPSAAASKRPRRRAAAKKTKKAGESKARKRSSRQAKK